MLSQNEFCMAPPAMWLIVPLLMPVQGINTLNGNYSDNILETAPELIADDWIPVIDVNIGK